MNSVNKYVLLAALSGGAMLAGAAQAAEPPQTGTITITGQVVDSTCQVDINGGVKSFDFGEIHKTDWDTAAADGAIIGQPQTVTFTVSNCPAYVKNVSVKFGNFDATDDTYLTKSGGTGEGVMFGVTDESGTTRLSGASPELTADVTGKDLTTTPEVIKANLHAYRKGSTFTAGDISAVSDVLVSWN